LIKRVLERRPRLTILLLHFKNLIIFDRVRQRSLILPSTISSLILFCFSVLYVFRFYSFVSIDLNGLNVRHRLIIMILCLLFDDDDWDNYINQWGTFWGLLGSLWLIKLNLPWFGFSPKRKGWIWRWTWL
jgi:hypothetical protein